MNVDLLAASENLSSRFRFIINAAPDYDGVFRVAVCIGRYRKIIDISEDLLVAEIEECNRAKVDYLDGISDIIQGEILGALDDSVGQSECLSDRSKEVHEIMLREAQRLVGVK